MKRSGYSQSNNANIIRRVSAVNSNIGQENGGIASLASNDSLFPFFECDIAATRNGTNHLLMTWNAELLSGCEMYKIYRILTPNNYTNIDWASNWMPNDVPTNILSGLGNCKYKSIFINEGDLYEEFKTQNRCNVLYRN